MDKLHLNSPCLKKLAKNAMNLIKKFWGEKIYSGTSINKVKESRCPFRSDSTVLDVRNVNTVMSK